MTIYPNTLQNSEDSKGLLVSIWLQDVKELYKYGQRYVPASPLVIGDNDQKMSIPVFTDPATLAFLTSRNVSYKGRPYTHSDGTTRIRIIELHVGDPQVLCNAKPAVTIPFNQFIETWKIEAVNCARKQSNDVTRMATD